MIYCEHCGEVYARGMVMQACCAGDSDRWMTKVIDNTEFTLRYRVLRCPRCTLYDQVQDLHRQLVEHTGVLGPHFAASINRCMQECDDSL